MPNRQTSKQTTQDSNPLVSASLPKRAGKPKLNKQTISRLIDKMEEIDVDSPWETYQELVQRTPLAQLEFLAKKGLVNSRAKAYLDSVIRKQEVNDSFAWDICREPISRTMADWMINNIRWEKHGNIISHLEHDSTHHCAWSHDEPAYTSHSYKISLAFIK